MLYLNFSNAIAEGDGDRIVRNWKFFLLHLFADGQSSVKYAMEALYLQLQQHCLLTPKQAYQQRWNRSVNNRGGIGKNVALDLDLEHDNNYCKVALKKIGSNLTENAITRVCKMIKVAREVIENVAKECKVMQRSGQHEEVSSHKDLEKIVNILIEEQAMKVIDGRKYHYFKKFKQSLLLDLDIQKLWKWINDHKNEMILS